MKTIMRSICAAMLAALAPLIVLQPAQADDEAVALLKKVSPVAWQNINLQGRFQFNNRPEPIDMEAIIRQLSLLRFDEP